MSEKRAATPEDAKAVWESFEKQGQPVSYRIVAAAMNAAGTFHEVHPRTINRWHKAGWTRKAQPGPKPAEIATQQKLESALPALTQEPALRVDELVGKPSAPSGEGEASQLKGETSPPEVLSPLQRRARALRAKLDGLDDAALLKEAARQGYITATILLKLVEENPDLLADKPRELGSLQAALAGTLATSNEAFKGLLDLCDRLMKTVPHEAEVVAPNDDFAEVMAAISAAADADA